jgi:hypothetical protein
MMLMLMLMMLMLMLAGLMLHPLLQGAVMMLLDQTLVLCHHASWLQPVMTMMLCLQSLALVLPCLLTLAS